MHYIQYYQKSPISGELTPVCGDRGVIICDGRNTLVNMIDDAYYFNGNKRPVYDAFQIMKGERMNDAQPITEIYSLEAEMSNSEEIQHNAPAP